MKDYQNFALILKEAREDIIGLCKVEDKDDYEEQMQIIVKSEDEYDNLVAPIQYTAFLKNIA